MRVLLVWGLVGYYRGRRKIERRACIPTFPSLSTQDFGLTEMLVEWGLTNPQVLSQLAPTTGLSGHTHTGGWLWSNEPVFTGHTQISVSVLLGHPCILTGFSSEYEVYKETDMPEVIKSWWGISSFGKDYIQWQLITIVNNITVL